MGYTVRIEVNHIQISISIMGRTENIFKVITYKVN